MKQKILHSSALMVLFGTIVGISTALYAVDPLWITRLTTASIILGLGSIGLFFVGMVYPKGD